MAIIDLGTFKVYQSIQAGRIDINVKYDTASKRISWNQIVVLPMFKWERQQTFNTIGNGGNRGYAEGQVYQTACSGYTQLSFAASNSSPWVTIQETTNSPSCGFIEPVPPPPPEPPPPPPICDLSVTAETLGITGFNKTDGQISVEISTTQSGNYTVNIFKQGTNDIIDNIVVSDLEPSYLFQNIPSGTYTVKANSNEYDCVAETDIIVPDFSFNEIYHFLFCEQRFDNRQIRISINKLGYTGASTLIPNGSADLVTISYPEKGDDMKFKPVIGSECVINIVMEELASLDGLNDIYTDQEKQYRLDLIFEDDQEFIWSGYVLPEQSNFPFKSKPYVISYEATDGIKTLEDIDFDITEGRLTFLQGIKYCLDKTDVRIGFKSMVDIENIEADLYVVLSGLEVNVYGEALVITPGTYTLNGDTKTISTSVEISLPLLFNSRPSYEGVIYLNQFGQAFLSKGLPSETTLLAEVDLFKGRPPRIKRVPNYNPDTLANHTFDVKRFIKEDGAFTDCFTVLEYICKQFTAQLKQSGGFWVIENIGAKGRDNLIESAYDNSLNVIYQNERIELLTELDCDAEGKVLAGAYIQNGAGWKRSIVSWKLGYPQPVITNFNFERWIDSGGKLVPYGWQLSTPYDYFERGSKYDRTYDPTTGDIETFENGTYYFNFNNLKQGRRTGLTPIWNTIDLMASNRKRIVSNQVAVFNQEVISVNLQLVVTFQDLATARLGFVFNLGNLYCRNHNGNRPIEPEWTTEYGVFVIEIETNTKINKPPYGDADNINFSIPRAPIQGYMTLSILEPIVVDFNIPSIPLGAKTTVNVGFDNIRIKKSSPISGATIKEETIITVENKKIFSTVPDPYEVYFGDVDNAFRTDGIKDLSNNPTQVWSRKGEDERDFINNIVARELLSQYQNTFRILEGEVLARDISIRSIFNLPGYELYRFATLSGSYDLLNCRAKITIAEVYAEEGENSGPIGGGGGIDPGQNPDFGILVLASKNNILASENENIFQVNGD